MPSSLQALSPAKARKSELSAGSGSGEEVLAARSPGMCWGSCSAGSLAWHWCLRSRRPLVGFPHRTWPAPWVRLLVLSSGARSSESRPSGRGPPWTSREKGQGLEARGCVSGRYSSGSSLRMGAPWGQSSQGRPLPFLMASFTESQSWLSLGGAGGPVCAAGTSSRTCSWGMSFLTSAL